MDATRSGSVGRSVAKGVGFLIGKRPLEFLFEMPVARLRNVDAFILEVESTLSDSVTTIGNELGEEPTPLPDVLYGDTLVTGRLESAKVELSAICAPSSGNALNEDMSYIGETVG